MWGILDIKCSGKRNVKKKGYGEIGKGFIHVHHIVPVSEIKESYRVDYEKDLIPICPNCHAMLHRKGGSVDGLKEVIKKNI